MMIFTVFVVFDEDSLFVVVVQARNVMLILLEWI